MSKKLEITEIRSSFEKEGYKLLSTECNSSKQKLEFICPNGHRHKISWRDWKRNRRCKFCGILNARSKNRHSLDFIRDQFAKENYILLTENYINNKQKLEFICPNGHRHSITYDSWNSGERCGKCSIHARKTIEFIREEFNKENFILLSKSYKNKRQKLKYICPKGHKHSVSWDGWNKGDRCPYCSGKIKKTIAEVRKSFEKEGYTLLSTEYINNEHKLQYICPEGHIGSIQWNNWVSGHRCNACGHRIISKKLSGPNNYKWKNYTPEQLREYKNYRKRVQYITNENFRKYYYEINPLGLPRGNEYHVDHIYSVIDGFLNNIDVEIISNPFNLQMLSAFDNISKNGRSDINIDELYYLYTYFVNTLQKRSEA